MTAVSIEQPATLDLALKDLAEVVRDRIARGRSTRSAGIKSVLAERFDGTFDQRAYGFGTFRRFLEEAERRGVISIANAPIGPDVDLTVPGQPASDLSSKASGGTRVRRDLWRAFVHWDAAVERFWNVRMMTVIELGNQPLNGAQTSGLVPISPISPDALKGWMQDFAEQTSDTIKAALIGSLQTPNPFRQFRGATDELGQTRQWRHYLQTKVVGVISDWITEHDLHIDLHEGAPANQTAPVGPAMLASPEEAIRGSVQEFVSRMTLPELMAVPIPMRLLAR